MSTVVAVGAQWGDEGKGKIVDWLGPQADLVARFQGGNNAGHTLVVDGETTILHVVPSGILHDGSINLIGPGVVVDPAILLGEIGKLEQRGILRDPSRLRVSGRAHVILPQVCAAQERRYHLPQHTVHDCTNDECIQRLLNYQADFALASVAPSHPDLKYEEVLRDRFVLLSCGPWRQRLKPTMHLDDLVDLPLISMTDASTAMRYISAAYLQRGVEFRPKMQFDQVGTIAGFVKKGLGIAVLPYLGMMPMLSLRGLRLSEIADGPVRSVGIVTRRVGAPTSVALAATEEV